MAKFVDKIKKGTKSLDRSTTKNRVVRLFILLALTLWAALILFMMDEQNCYRPEWLGGVDFGKSQNIAGKLGFQQSGTEFVSGLDYSKNWLSNFLYNICGLKPMNVQFSTWVIFITIILAIWTFSTIDIFGIKLKAKFNIDKEDPSYGRKNLVFTLIVLLSVVILALLFIGVYLSIVKVSVGFKFNGKVFVNLIKTLIISLLAIFFFPIIALLFYVAFVIIIWLFSAIGRAVTKRVVADKQVQKLLDDAKESSQHPLKVTNSGGDGGNGSGSGNATEYDLAVAKIFPSLNRIDTKYQDESLLPKLEETGTTLQEVMKRFRAYLCHRQLYFSEKLLREFIGGLAVSRLMILEGLSGTGKSTLPRLFSDFIGNKVFYAPVQATWRDRTDLIGYYSDFTNEFKETDFLKRLYEANYRNEEINMMVLDEMNISRIEYYFADFLSVLEYPSQDWLIKVMQIKDGQGQPTKFEDGNVRIPQNTWFIGTANTDDSTFTITDKVYDRAMVIDFLKVNEPFELEYNDEEIHISALELNKLFEDAKQNQANRLNSDEIAKFKQLCNFVLDTFNVTFGNRIMNQIENFVPVYVELGGTKVEALDFIFARKVMRKLQGKYDESVKDGLGKMIRFINTLYGKDQLPYTEEAIIELRKKLI